MARSKFILAAFIALMVGLPSQSYAQQMPAPSTAQTGPEEIGNVASVEGAATVTRNGQPLDLKLQDPIFNGDVLRTGPDATLGVIFDDETTFNLSANSSILVDSFVYEKGTKKNKALFSVALGTVAFAAHEVARTGDMKIATPTSVLGIRGTTGVVEVPAGTTPGSVGQVAVKLYPDANGRVGRIELFGAGGGGQRLGLLTRASTGFAIRPGAAGRFAAVPLAIPPQQAARDRAFVQRTFAAQGAGRQLIIQRQNLRAPNLQRQRQQPGLRQPNAPRPGATPPGQRTPSIRQPGSPRPATAPPGTRTPPQQTAPGGRRTGLPNTPNLQPAPNAPAVPNVQRGANAPRVPSVRAPNATVRVPNAPGVPAVRPPAKRKPPVATPPPR